MKLFCLMFFCATRVFSQRTSHVCSSSETPRKCCAEEISDKIDQLQHKLEEIPQTDCPNEVTRHRCTPTDQNFCRITHDEAITNDNLPTNCKDIYDSGNEQSGVYTIYEPLDPSFHRITPFRTAYRKKITVYCDLNNTAPGGPGWIVFQRRQDGSVNFTRLWNQYKDGFGNLIGEHWLGNDNLALITQGNQKYELRIELGDWSGQRRHALYNTFKVHNETNKYMLELGRYSGDAGDSMDQVRSRYFSTIDRDNDGSVDHCALLYHQAGFWYRACGHAFLNNPYHNSRTCESQKGIVWYHWHSYSYSLKFVQMKIRPTN